MSDRYLERATALCRERGLRLQQFGEGWRVVGEDVDVIFAELRDVTAAALAPSRKSVWQPVRPIVGWYGSGRITQA